MILEIQVKLEKIKNKMQVNSENIYETSLSKEDEKWLFKQASKLVEINELLTEMYETEDTDDCMDLGDFGELVMNIMEKNKWEGK